MRFKACDPYPNRVVVAFENGFHGVFEEIEKELLQHHFVAPQGGKILLKVDLKPSVEFSRLDVREFHCFLDHLRNEHGLKLRVRLLRKPADTLDDFPRAHRLVFDALEGRTAPVV